MCQVALHACEDKYADECHFHLQIEIEGSIFYFLFSLLSSNPTHTFGDEAIYHIIFPFSGFVSATNMFIK